MNKKKKFLIIGSICVLGALGLAAPASADQPGPGDKQCIPGQQGNPHPAHKAGVCYK